MKSDEECTQVILAHRSLWNSSLRFKSNIHTDIFNYQKDNSTVIGRYSFIQFCSRLFGASFDTPMKKPLKKKQKKNWPKKMLQHTISWHLTLIYHWIVKLMISWTCLNELSIHSVVLINSKHQLKAEKFKGWVCMIKRKCKKNVVENDLMNCVCTNYYKCSNLVSDKKKPVTHLSTHNTHMRTAYWMNWTFIQWTCQVLLAMWKSQ